MSALSLDRIRAFLVIVVYNWLQGEPCYLRCESHDNALNAGENCALKGIYTTICKTLYEGKIIIRSSIRSSACSLRTETWKEEEWWYPSEGWPSSPESMGARCGSILSISRTNCTLDGVHMITFAEVASEVTRSSLRAGVLCLSSRS